LVTRWRCQKVVKIDLDHSALGGWMGGSILFVFAWILRMAVGREERRWTWRLGERCRPQGRPQRSPRSPLGAMSQL